MLAATFGGSLGVQILAGVLVAAIVSITVAAGRWYKSHQDTARKAQTLTEYLFDTSADPETHVPGRKGWTTVMEERDARAETRLDALEKRRRG